MAEDWYEKRGYTGFEIVKDYLRETDRDGKVWNIDFVWMKKVVGVGKEEVGEEKTQEKMVNELVEEAREKGVATPTI